MHVIHIAPILNICCQNLVCGKLRGDGARRRGPQTLGIIHGVFRHHNESEIAPGPALPILAECDFMLFRHSRASGSIVMKTRGVGQG